jgi:predicted phage tail component-like protein
MTFRGIRKDYITVLRGRKRPPWSSIQRNIVTIPGRVGGYLFNTKIDPKLLEVPVLIMADSFSDLQKLKEDLAMWLVTDTPQELIFDDEPDRIYYAVVDGSLDLDELVRWGQGVIRFICPDPYKYGAEHTYIIPNGQDIFDIDNPGTADAEPKFKITLNEDVTFLSIVRDDSFMMVGKPLDEVNETPKQELEVILEDNMTTTSGGWTSANTFVENGDVTGAFSSSGSYFYASNFGTGSLWHGPALKKSLPEALQDFQVEFIVQFNSNGDPKKMGRIELILLDTNNQTVAKLAMKDVYQGYAENHAEMRAGNISTGTRLIDGGPLKKDDWDDFYGMLRLSREGNIWRAYVAVIDSNGKHVKTRSETFTDHKNQYMAPITQVMVHIAQRGTIAPADMKIHKVKVFKRNSLGSSEIPIIAKAGDVIEFDHESAMVYKNGEDFRSALDLSSDFFTLKPGTNRLSLLPEGVGNIEVTFRERFL